LNLVLIDTSAWIAFFRGDRAAVSRIDPLLAEGNAAVCGPTYSELVSGAPSPAENRRLATLLRGLDWLEPATAIWERVADARFALARSGKQAAVLDLFIAWVAADHGAELLTRDRDFEDIGRIVPLQLRRF
jgi:predicted nucleic acid-binding protein